MKDKKVLLIDDDVSLLQLAGILFKREGAEVDIAHDGIEGIIKLFTYHPDLIILDIMMPGTDGFEVCRKIREVSDTPLMMLTALNHDQQMLLGLEAGADDFLSKPFNADVLLARARAVLRRSAHRHVQHPSYTYNDGYLSINIEKRQVLIKSKRIKLTPLEFHLLVYLARNAGKVLTFEKILAQVWGNEYLGNIDYVHVYISRLRKIVEENPKEPQYIVTVHGVGYIFDKSEVSFVNKDKS